jgi:hypothetical protein
MMEYALSFVVYIRRFGNTAKQINMHYSEMTVFDCEVS